MNTGSKWELDICYPDVALLPSLADTFSVSVDTLLGYAPQEPERRIGQLIHDLFDGAPREELFKLAVRISTLLHQAVYTMGYTQAVPWETRQEIGALDWGLSFRTEKEGSSLRTGRQAFFSAAEDRQPDRSTLRQLAASLASLADTNALQVLYALEDGEMHGLPDIMARTRLDAAQAAAALDTLPVSQGDDGYTLKGCYLHIPQVLRLLMQGDMAL